MNYSQQADKLAGPIGLLKQSVNLSYFCWTNRTNGGYAHLDSFLKQAVKLLRVCFLILVMFFPLRRPAHLYPRLKLKFVDATQIFGGRALTVTGMGKFIENVSAKNSLQ